jgi:hypothetical protein
MKSMFQMATVALACGVTRVVGISVGHHFGHDDLAIFNNNLFPYPSYSPHGGARYHDSMRILYQFMSQNVVDMLDAVGASQTVVAFVSGTALSINKDHHGKTPLRFPVALFDGTGRARTGARYLRYDMGQRSVNDFYNTLGHLMGAPLDSFGTGGFNKSSGPLPELL